MKKYIVACVLVLAGSFGCSASRAEPVDGAVGAGPVGAVGARGQQGEQGPAGSNGLPGAVGPMGATGATGAEGPAGPSGAPGSTGAVGPAGPSTPGAAGAPGPTGATGIVGSKADVYERVVAAPTLGDGGSSTVHAACDAAGDILISGWCEKTTDSTPLAYFYRQHAENLNNPLKAAEWHCNMTNMRWGVTELIPSATTYSAHVYCAKK